MNYSYKDRFRYYFENTISSGPFGVIKWLGLISLASILFLGVLIIVFGIKDNPEAETSLGFIEGVWKSLMATLDPGTMGGDEGWDFRIVRFSATLLGVFIISILIGIISSGIDEKLEELYYGYTLNNNIILFKENYAWIDEELERRNSIIFFKEFFEFIVIRFVIYYRRM